MKRLVLWVASNLDAFSALVLALSVGALGLTTGVPQGVVDSAILLTLAVLAESILRDRWRRGGTEQEVYQSVQQSAAVLRELPRQLSEVDELVGSARAAFNQASMVRMLTGAEVGQVQAEARQRTDLWYFKGGTGTFIRAVTLPECIENARRRRGTLDFRIEILDPSNEEVCDLYARFRRSLSDRPDATGELWTVDRTRKESYATILAACWHQQRSGLLRIDVWLSPLMSTFRADLSSSCVIITQEDPSVPAMMIDSDKIHYRRWNIELQYSREQARKVPIEQAKQVVLDDEPTVEQTRRLFSALTIPLPRSFGDREVSDIILKAIKARNPYAT
ncbi:MAG TPA: hypothetical protein VJT31_32005 [Rugosimonospora sp.]|nr:hypothetical protein [Rugosimonospora sp.]